jgi:Ca2+/Na+ antiporter
MTASLIVALLVIATVWGFYLLPSLMGDRRDAPLSSTEQFNRWTSLMADVQRRQVTASASSSRVTVRARRRRVLAMLIGVAVVTLALAWWQNSLNWLLVHLAVDVLLAIYVAVLVQLRQRRDYRVATDHLPERQAERQESQVRVVAR